MPFASIVQRKGAKDRRREVVGEDVGERDDQWRKKALSEGG